MSDETEPKPMDPERLAQFRQFKDFPGGAFTRHELAELLADRDHQARRADAAEAEVKRWRARCPVTAEDVECLTLDQANAWGAGRFVFQSDCGFVRVESGSWGWNGLHLGEVVEAVADREGRVAHDILDEMAAMEVRE